MTSRERISIAMNGGKPDRVPIWCLLSLQHIVDLGLVFTVEEFFEFCSGGDEVVAAIFSGEGTDQVARAAELLDAIADMAIADLEIL